MTPTGRRFHTALLGISQKDFAGWECCARLPLLLSKINYLDTVKGREFAFSPHFTNWPTKNRN
jgi:hypothetical protein